MDSLEELWLQSAEEVYLTEQETAKYVYECDHDPEELFFDDDDAG